MEIFLSCMYPTLKAKKRGTLIRQFCSDLMCSYQQWWCTPCINISLTPLVASRKRQIASACLCNLLFCWRLQETVAVHVPAWNMIQQGGKTMRQRACESAMDNKLERERGSCAINRNIVENVECSCTDRGLYRIQMCLHAVGRRAWEVCERPSSFWALWVKCWHESGQTPLPLSSHGLSHLICQWSIFAPAAVCVRETTSASMCVRNQPPIFSPSPWPAWVCVCCCRTVLMKRLSDIWSLM